MKRLTLGALVLVSASVIVAAGCGGDDSATGTSADEWAQEFCTTVVAYRDDLEQIRDGLGESLDVGSLEVAADDASARTDEFVDELRALGPPDTESGQEVEDSIEALADTAEAEKDDVQEAVDAVSDVSDLPGALTTIGTSLQEMATALQRTVDAIEAADVDGELKTAFEQNAACDELNT
jgi:hypothetical protein